MQFKVFKDLKIKEDDWQGLYRSFQLRESHKNAVEVRYGDVGDKFYVILRGEVSVWIPKPAAEMVEIMQTWLNKRSLKSKLLFAYVTKKGLLRNINGYHQ